MLHLRTERRWAVALAVFDLVWSADGFVVLRAWGQGATRPQGHPDYCYAPAAVGQSIIDQVRVLLETWWLALS